MDPKRKGKLRRDIQKKVQKSGVTYIYDRILVYNQETKGYKQVATRLIGKLPSGKTDLKDMVETRPKRVNGQDFHRRKAAEANWEHYLHAYEVQEGIASEESAAAYSQDNAQRALPSHTAASARNPDGAQDTDSSESSQNAYAVTGQGNTEDKNNDQLETWVAHLFRDYIDFEKVHSILAGQSVLEKRTAYMVDALLDWIGKTSGIDRLVEQSFPGDKETAQKVLSMARFWTAKQGETIDTIDAWSMFHRLPYRDALSSDICHTAMHAIGLNASVSERFFKGRAKRCPDKALLLIDSTTIHSYLPNRSSVGQGNNMADNKLPVARVFTLYCAQTREPVSYFLEYGSVPDIKHLVDSVNHHTKIRGEWVTRIVCNDGFFSENNLSFASNGHLDILVRCPIQCNWIYPEFRKIFDSLKNPENVCESDTDVHCEVACFQHSFPRKRQRSRNGIQAGEVVYDTRRVYVYFFLDENRERAERHVYLQQLNEAKKEIELTGDTNCLTKQLRKFKKRFDVRRNPQTDEITVEPKMNRINEDLNLCGCFALITFKKIPNDEVLRDDRIREKTEEGFQEYKVFHDADPIRSYTDMSLYGRLFCQFIALCYEEFLSRRIREAKTELSQKIATGVDSGTLGGKNLEAEIELLRWLNSMTIKEIFDQLDAYKDSGLTEKASDGIRADSALRRDSMFFELLGMKNE